MRKFRGSLIFIAVLMLSGCIGKSNSASMAEQDTIKAIKAIKSDYYQIQKYSPEQLEEIFAGKTLDKYYFNGYDGFWGSSALLDRSKGIIGYVNHIIVNNVYLIILTKATSDSTMIVKDVKAGILNDGQVLRSLSGELNEHRIDHLIVITSDTTLNEVYEKTDNVFIFDLSAFKIQDINSQNPIVYNEIG